LKKYESVISNANQIVPINDASPDIKLAVAKLLCRECSILDFTSPVLYSMQFRCLSCNTQQYLCRNGNSHTQTWSILEEQQPQHTKWFYELRRPMPFTR
jgi:hypothetical protein